MVNLQDREIVIYEDKEESQVIFSVVIRLLSGWQHLRALPKTVLLILSLQHVADFKMWRMNRHLGTDVQKSNLCLLRICLPGRVV